MAKIKIFPYLCSLFLPLKKSGQINVNEAKELIAGKSAIVIDYRKSDDYDKSHIDGAFFLKGDILENFIDQTDKHKPIICYCYKGISSKALCARLIKAGFENVYNLKGGYDAWCKNRE